MLRRWKLKRMARRGDVAGLWQLAHEREVHIGPDGSQVDLKLDRRRTAVHALSAVHDEQAEVALAQLVLEGPTELGLEAVRVLSERDSPTAAGHLARACGTIGHPDDQSRRHGLAILADRRAQRVAMPFAEGVLSESRTAPPSTADRRTLLTLLENDTPATHALIVGLIEALGDESETRADRAATLLAWLGKPAQGAVLASLAYGGQRVRALQVLGWIGDQSSIATLTEFLLHSTVAAERRVAAEALAALRTPDAIDPLVQATRDPDLKVRDAAFTALDRYGAMATILQLTGALRNEVASPLALAPGDQAPEAPTDGHDTSLPQLQEPSNGGDPVHEEIVAQPGPYAKRSHWFGPI